MKFERDIPVFLSVYRFLTYGLAVILTQVIPVESSQDLPTRTYVLLGFVGVYTFLKVAGPFRGWRPDDTFALVVLWIDFAICVGLLLFTGGLSSAYLLYSLTPLITAALLFSERLSLSIATVSSAAVFLAHLSAVWWDTPFDPVVQDNRLLWLILFIMTNYLVATTVYRTNMNLRQRIELSAVEAERRRIRWEMHDGLAQALGYLTMKTELVVKFLNEHHIREAETALREVVAATKDTYQEVRDSLDQLQTDTGPFSKALSDYVAAFRQRSGVEAYLQMTPPEVRLSPRMDAQLLRIVQEALSNVRRHSGATSTWVDLRADRASIELVIRDNGHGIEEPNGQENGSGHHGLSIMRERAESMGGSLSITSLPGQGTTVRVSLPNPRKRG